MVQELLSGTVVGHVAATLSRDQDLLSGLFLMFQHRNGVALPHGRTRPPIRPAAPAPITNTFAIQQFLPQNLIFLLYHTRIVL